MPTAGDRNRKTRMTTLITKFKILDLESPSNFQVKEKKLFKSVYKKINWTFVVQTVIWGKYDIRFGIPIEFPSQRKKIIQIGQETMKLCFN